MRLALGATRGDILRLILRQGAVLVGFGVALGLGGYFALSTLIGKLLFEVVATDAPTLLAAPFGLTLVALAACWLPARRAARVKVNPMVALRCE